MRISRIGVVGLTAAAMLASGAGYALAASPAGPSITGNEHFSLMTTQPSGTHLVIIVNGLFTAGGSDTHFTKVDVVKLPNGTFRVHHPGPVTIIRQTLNPLTCLATYSAKVAITLGEGTGQYRGISGAGTASINAVAIFTRNRQHQCAIHKNPAQLEETISGNSTVTLP